MRKLYTTGAWDYCKEFIFSDIHQDLIFIYPVQLIFFRLHEQPPDFIPLVFLDQGRKFRDFGLFEVTGQTYFMNML